MKNNFSNLQSCFYSLVNELIKAPEVNSRGSTQKELLFQNFCITDPTDIGISIPDRKFSINYAVAEWLWYISSNPNINNIGKMATIWKNISDEFNCDGIN